MNYDDGDRLSKRFGALVFHALTQMGSYQRANIETKATESLQSIESQITAAVKDVRQEVTQLKKEVENLLALPPSS